MSGGGYLKTGPGADQSDEEQARDGSVSQGRAATSGSGNQPDKAEGVNKALKSMIDGMCPVPQKSKGRADDDDDDENDDGEKPKRRRRQSTEDQARDPEVLLLVVLFVLAQVQTHFLVS